MNLNSTDVIIKFDGHYEKSYNQTYKLPEIQTFGKNISDISIQALNLDNSFMSLNSSKREIMFTCMN